jgi:hypothetical protein
VSALVHCHRKPLSIFAGLLIAVTLIVGGCGDSAPSTGSDTDTTSEPVDSTVDPLTTVRFTDPTQPVGVAIGRKFELVLPADPARGWRWVLEPIDTAVVVALSSTFIDDPELLASTSPTTTPEPTGTTEPAVTWIPTTTTTLEPDAPENAPLVQIITFAGRSVATTAIRLRYEPISGGTSNPRTVTFDVVVFAEQS